MEQPTVPTTKILYIWCEKSHTVFIFEQEKNRLSATLFFM